MNIQLSALATLAIELREALDADALVEERTRLEWVESKMRVIALLVKARKRLNDNETFGNWISQNGLDHFGKDDRAAAISLGRDMDLCRAVLLDSDSISLRVIWDKNRWRYNTSATTLRNDAKSKTPETASSDDNNPTDKGGASVSPLVKAFGAEAAGVILKHYNRKTRTTQRLAQKLNHHQGKKLATFIRSTSDLPRPPNSDADLGLGTIWAGAPNAMVNKYRRGRSEAEALMQAIDCWPTEIAPMVADWRASGQTDANQWYASVTPMQTAAEVQAETDAAIDATVAKMTSELERTKPRFDPSCRAAHKGPIRHFGAQIWPPPKGYNYAFDDAWYVATIWRLFDQHLARVEPSPKTRAAGFMKLLIGCLRNLNSDAGEIISLMLWAQDGHPERTSPEENVCPSYDSVQ
jgi:hypothetical protein